MSTAHPQRSGRWQLSFASVQFSTLLLPKDPLDAAPRTAVLERVLTALPNVTLAVGITPTIVVVGAVCASEYILGL
jgi:hypothetical protein